jgi:hypothetical protein
MKSKTPPTLRGLLDGGLDLKEVYHWINKKDRRNIAKCDRPTYKQTFDAYSKVVTELLLKPKAKPYKFPIVVRVARDLFDKHDFNEVCFLNPNYVAPAKGLKPWGGNPPKGHYNCNTEKHNQYFGFGWTPWSKIIDTLVLVEGKAKKLPVTAILGEILWEMTFSGWTEEATIKRGKDILKRWKDAKKDIKEGKFVEIPPKKKGGYKIVIPKTVQQDFKDIIDKSST